MKREQKIFAMLMAASMAFAGISTVTMASAAPVSFHQVQLGNYIDDGTSTVADEPADAVLPSGKKVIKKSADSSSRTTAQKAVKTSSKSTKKVISKEETAKTTASGRKVIKAKKSTVQQKESAKSLSGSVNG